MTVQERFDTWYAKIHENNQLITAGSLLQRAAAQSPQTIAIICDDQQLTYQQAYDRAVIVTKKLQTLPLQRDERVILLCENSLNYFSLYYGIWQIGAIIVPVNIFFHEHELEHVINDCQPTLIVTSEKFAEKIKNLKVTLPAIVYEHDFDFTAPAEKTALTVPASQEDAVAAILYTSGTTGLPKGVMLSHRNILINVIQAIAAFGQTNERAYAALPLFHSYMQNTCLWASVLANATVIIVPKIDRKALLKGLEHKPTVLLGIPQLYGLFCMMKKINFDAVTHFICGGDALPDKIRLCFELIYGRKICNGYGMTESSPFIAVDLDDAAAATNTVGNLMYGIQATLRDEQDSDISPHNIGVLWVRGANIMLGYYNAPEATAKILHDGWLNTGDLATFDENGKLIICGRQKDLIVNKGIKIYPQEIENIIMGHPVVTACGVVGMPDHDGEVPVAFIATKEESPTLREELKNLCNNNLAAYKVPRDYIIERELPMTSTGKVDKKVLREQLKNKPAS